MNNLHSTLRKQNFSCIFYFSIAFVCIFRMSRGGGLANDFQVFYNSGINYRLVGNPYIDSNYLNGPLFSVLMSLFSELDFWWAITIMRLFSIILIPYSIKIIHKIFEIKSSTIEIYYLSALLILTFPIQTIMAYGQFTIVGNFLLLFMLFQIKSCHFMSTNQLILIPIVSISLFDYKPHMYFFYLIFIILKSTHKRFILIGHFCAFVLYFSFFAYHNQLILFRYWLRNIFFRGSGNFGVDDLLTFYALSNINKAIYLIITIYFIFNFRRHISLNFKAFEFEFLVLIISILGALLLPYWHPQDSGLIFALLISLSKYAIYPPSVKVIYFVCLSFCYIWSNTVPGFLLFSIIIFSALKFFDASHLVFKSTNSSFLFLIFPSLIYLILAKFNFNLVELKNLFYLVSQLISFICLLSIKLAKKNFFIS